MKLARVAALLLLLPLPAWAAEGCRWREPVRSFDAGEAWSCAAIAWADGDTFTAACEAVAGTVRVRLRGVDTVERGDPAWAASRLELRRRTEGLRLAVLPHHGSFGRVVADVLAEGVNVGAAMDRDGWSKAGCPKR
jgi:endonuclease YncB( thermonuclease family)